MAPPHATPEAARAAAAQRVRTGDAAGGVRPARLSIQTGELSQVIFHSYALCMGTAENNGGWTLLTGHGHVLVAIAKNPAARVRDLAVEAGLTERTTQAIIADLEQAGYLTRHRVGRRTEYVLHTSQGFRHRSQDGLLIGPFLEMLAASGGLDGVSRPPTTAQTPAAGTDTDGVDDRAPQRPHA